VARQRLHLRRKTKAVTLIRMSDEVAHRVEGAFDEVTAALDAAADKGHLAQFVEHETGRLIAVGPTHVVSVEPIAPRPRSSGDR
jgi:hypothetical protein